jgi:poly(3-hydroxybutyrate) depolymerase
MNQIAIFFSLFNLNLMSTQLTPGDHTRTIEVDKRTRSYIVHVPPKYDSKKRIGE